MRFSGVRLVSVFLAAIFWGGTACSMTLQLGSAGNSYVSPGDTWRFLRGKEPASTLADAWKEVSFDDSKWETGPSGFGYGDNDDATVLADMEGHYVSVYIRKEFTVSPLVRGAALELTVDYDDGFVAYLNGKEVARRGMPAGPATYQTLASLSHEAGTPETISLGAAGDWLQEGKNVLAIEGHNNSLTSSDLSLIPSLRTTSDTLRNGSTYIVTTDTVVLTGRTEALAGLAGATGAWWVVVGDISVDPNLVDGTWQASVPLSPGLNAIIARAFGGDPPRGGARDSGSIEILYVPPANHIAGEQKEDVTLSDA
jgi:hypothetical protein